MRHLLFAIVLCGLSIQSVGCGLEVLNKGRSKTGVAVIDLDAVAKRLGRDVELLDAFKQYENKLNQQFATMHKSFREKITDKNEQIGDKPTDLQVQELTSLTQQANLRINQVRQQAQGMLTQHRVNLINRFREEAKPIARKVASEKGLNMVITKNDAVLLVYETAVDITDEVVERMLARSSDKSPSPSATSANKTAAETPKATAKRPPAKSPLR